MQSFNSISTFFRKLGSTISSRRYCRLSCSKILETKNPFFCYTSGRWLDNEQLQFERRYVEFNISALQQTAGQILGTRCTQMTKLPEGLYNKVFSLKMANGQEILAKIPNPNAGNPHYVVASEVATLDFVRDGNDFYFILWLSLM